jgi:hypothetical protein
MLLGIETRKDRLKVQDEGGVRNGRETTEDNWRVRG